MSDPSRILTEAIRAELAVWLRDGLAKDAAEINSGAARGGCCSDFSNRVLHRIGSDEADEAGIQELGIDNLQVVDGDDFESGRPLDRALLAEHWKGTVPPEGLTWDDLDRLSDDASFHGGTHVWLAVGGRHYDSETPEGVDGVFELPFFVRVVKSWIEECPQPAGASFGR